MVQLFVDQCIVYDYDKASASHYADVCTELEQRGEIIGANDLLIAAHALSMDAVLVTNNTKEFSRVSGLVLENWA